MHSKSRWDSGEADRCADPATVETPVQTDSLRGELNAVDVTLERRARDLMGELIIGSSAEQYQPYANNGDVALSLISPTAFPESRKHRCCQLFDANGRAAPTAPTQLKPGDVKYFSVRFQKRTVGTKPCALAKVLFSDRASALTTGEVVESVRRLLTRLRAVPETEMRVALWREFSGHTP